jgi:hypothetical protein
MPRTIESGLLERWGRLMGGVFLVMMLKGERGYATNTNLDLPS